MPSEKKNPLIGAFREPAQEPSPPAEPPKGTAPTPVVETAPAKAGEVKKPIEPPKAAEVKAAPPAPEKPSEAKKPAETPKAVEDKGKKSEPARVEEGKKPEPAKADEGKRPTEASKAPAADKPAPEKPGEKKPAEPAKATTEDKGKPAPAKVDEGKKPEPAKGDEKKPAEAVKSPNLRFVALSKIVPLPGTYVKDEPREDYSELIASIKKNGMEKPVILRKGDKDTFQLVDGFHRCKALEKAGMLEVRADVYDMTLKEASDYRRNHRKQPDLPIPGKLIPYPPVEPEKAKAPAPAKSDEGKKPAEPLKEDKAAPAEVDEIPKDFTLPITKAGQSEIITTLKVADIRPFEGHPFNVRDDKDMWDLVDSVKKFGVLEPAVVIPRKEGGFEMVSGHRRRRACELAGIATMPVIVRQLDRDEAIISMVDANLKRENITPMEKARAYTMKLEAMKRKAGRRSKAEILSGEKPMRADEQLAQQTGESRANIQKITRLTKLEPELQQMVEEKKLPVHTAADLSYLKKDEQKAVADAIKKEDKVPSGTQAAELKKASQTGTLTQAKIESTVAPTKREENPPLKVTLTEEELRPYFPDKRTTIPDVKRGLFEALDLRKKAIERQKARQAEKEGKKPDSPAR